MTWERAPRNNILYSHNHDNKQRTSKGTPKGTPPPNLSRSRALAWAQVSPTVPWIKIPKSRNQII